MNVEMESSVKALVARHFNLPPSKVCLDAAFVGELGGDALDLVELGAEIESAFDLRLSVPARDSLVTVRDVLTLLCDTPVADCC